MIHSSVSNNKLRELRIEQNLTCLTLDTLEITLESAKLYFKAMISPHMTYWAHSHKSTLKPVETAHKLALKILDKKPHAWGARWLSR